MGLPWAPNRQEGRRLLAVADLGGPWGRAPAWCGGAAPLCGVVRVRRWLGSMGGASNTCALCTARGATGVYVCRGGGRDCDCGGVGRAGAFRHSCRFNAVLLTTLALGWGLAALSCLWFFLCWPLTCQDTTGPTAQSRCRSRLLAPLGLAWLFPGTAPSCRPCMHWVGTGQGTIMCASVCAGWVLHATLCANVLTVLSLKGP